MQVLKDLRPPHRNGGLTGGLGALLRSLLQRCDPQRRPETSKGNRRQTVRKIDGHRFQTRNRCVSAMRAQNHTISCAACRSLLTIGPTPGARGGRVVRLPTQAPDHWRLRGYPTRHRYLFGYTGSQAPTTRGIISRATIFARWQRSGEDTDATERAPGGASRTTDQGVRAVSVLCFPRATCPTLSLTTAPSGA